MYFSPVKPVNIDKGWGITLTVERNCFSYHLDESDIKLVSSRYGRVNSVELDPEDGKVARIYFADADDALAAVKDLDGTKLPSPGGVLAVKWGLSYSIESVNTQDKSIINDNTNKSNASFSLAATESGNSSNIYYDNENNIENDMYKNYYNTESYNNRAYSTSLVRKYTCRFDIGISNENDFQVAKKLIGNKGSNMKRIVKVADELRENFVLNMQQQPTKLRLRGEGSGFLEGPGRRESDEPLHLCVSSVDYTSYKRAQIAVSELLADIYTDYDRFLSSKGLPTVNLKISIKETPIMQNVSNNGSPWREQGNLYRDESSGFDQSTQYQTYHHSHNQYVNYNE